VPVRWGLLPARPESRYHAASMILAGDIGATKTMLAVFDQGDLRRPLALETHSSRDHASFHQLVEEFVGRVRPRIDLACVGVAGPVEGNRCATTNLPWLVDGAELAADLGIDRALLVNDLEACAFGIDLLSEDEVFELQAGVEDAEGNRAVIAAGTGLGEAGLYWDGSSHRPFPCEGGHTGFAPRDELEIELLRFLLREYERVSVERLISGMGLEAIYRFFTRHGHADEPEELGVAMAQGDSGEAITRYARQGMRSCRLTLDLFVSLYGCEAGDLALKVMATGGVFVGGGIAPKILTELANGRFLEAFRAKGRMRPLLESMPVRVILDPQTALRGAARAALLAVG